MLRRTPGKWKIAHNFDIYASAITPYHKVCFLYNPKYAPIIAAAPGMYDLIEKVSRISLSLPKVGCLDSYAESIIANIDADTQNFICWD